MPPDILRRAHRLIDTTANLVLPPRRLNNQQTLLLSRRHIIHLNAAYGAALALPFYIYKVILVAVQCRGLLVHFEIQRRHNEWYHLSRATGFFFDVGVF